MRRSVERRAWVAVFTACLILGPACGCRRTSESGVHGEKVCDVDTEYSFGWKGWKVTWVEEVTLAPPRVLVLQRHLLRSADTPVPASAKTASRCRVLVPECGQPGTTVGVVMTAMLDPAVQNAFAGDVALYGEDRMAADRPLFYIRRSDGKEVQVGGQCPVIGVDCQRVPAGLQALVDVLGDMVKQARGRPECKDLQ